MLAVGCRFTEILTDGWRMPVPANLVQIDVDPDQIGMNYPVAVGIVADARPGSGGDCSMRSRVLLAQRSDGTAGARSENGRPRPSRRGRNG